MEKNNKIKTLEERLREATTLEEVRKITFKMKERYHRERAKLPFEEKIKSIIQSQGMMLSPKRKKIASWGKERGCRSAEEVILKLKELAMKEKKKK